MNEQLRLRQLAGLSTDKSVLDAFKKAHTNTPIVKESIDFSILRKMAGLPQVIESEEDVPTTTDIPQDDIESQTEIQPTDVPAEDEEETLPAIIKKIAKSIEGKAGEELEEALMKVYNAGVDDGKKQSEETKEDDIEPEEPSDIKPEDTATKE